MASKKKQKEKRTNEAIGTDQVILVDDREAGELSLADAIARARDEGGDLVEVSPGHDPAECRIIVARREEPPLDLSEAPTPLFEALAALDSEDQPFRRVHRLIDAVEVFTKLHTVAVVSDIFSGEGVTEDMRGILAAGLKQPALGHWWMFAREFGKRYGRLGRAPIAPGLDHFVGGKGALFKILEKNDNLITFRNSYAHGATPSDEDCAADCETHEPRLRGAIAAATHFREALWLYVDSAGRCLRATGAELVEIDPPASDLQPLRCYLVRDKQIISLHPLLVYREDEGRFFFYNDLKSKGANFLNYERALHHRDASLGEDLLERFPIHDWSGQVPEDFAERIQQLTEGFKGRRKELRELIRFCETQETGFHLIWGGPGIGKSSLLARLVEMLRWPAELRAAENLSPASGDGATAEAPGSPDGQVRHDGTEPRADGLPAEPGRLLVFEYFIRRGQRTADADYLLENLNGRIESVFRTGIPLGNTPAEKARFLEERLAAAASGLGSGDRIVLFIDGLDESIDAPELLAALPKDLPGRVLAFYASRDVPAVRQGVYENLDREHRTGITLGGLARNDVRALLADSVSKYDLEDDYLDAVADASEGNPLYLALLCDGLVEGDYRINEIDRLPRGMEELYETVLRRVTGTEGAGDFLRLLAAGRGDFSPEMAASLLDLPVDRVAGQIIPACRELLVENELTEDLDDYQLFHESLRHHLRERFPAEDRRWRRRLGEWCVGWREHQDESLRYALAHLAAHARDLLADGPAEEADEWRDRLVALLDDEDYGAASFGALGHGAGFQAHCRLLLDQLPHVPEQQRRGLAARAIARYHCEPEDRFRATLRSIDRAGTESGGLADLAHLARSGRSPRDRALLALRGLAAAPDVDVPAQLRADLTTWAEEANEPALASLVEATLQKNHP